MTPKDLVDRAIILLGRDGITPELRRSTAIYRTTNKPGGPWVYIRYSNKNCTLLRTFIYGLISKRLPTSERFIPSECQNCYKVVVRPEIYDDLLKLKGVMEGMDYPSKCGIEKREAVDALYGGYWYCDGLKEGLERLNQVKFALLGTGMEIFLKRGCTEYEAEFGPSDAWEIKEGQVAIEEEVSRRLRVDNFKFPQEPHEIKSIMEGWEAYATELGPVYKGSHDYVTYVEG